MRGLLSLPASLVALALTQCAASEELQWPYNLPRNARYYPEHEAHVKRGLEVQERLQWDKPAAVRKMGEDPGEKFYLDYWEFTQEPAMRQRVYYDALGGYANASSTCMLLSPLAPHTNHERGLFGRSLFKRDFECPANTISCSNINSDLCCAGGETCVNTSDGVGCCPSGGDCGDDVAGCDTDGGYTSCPESKNGGCCVPGAKCLDEGCVFYGTSTVTTTLPTATATTGTVNPTTMSSETENGGTTVVVTSGSTTTVTISGDGSTVTTTVVSPTTIIIGGTTASSSTCTSGFFSCVSEDGGGCCRNGQACQDNGCQDVTTTTTATAAAPVRPTTSATSTDTSVSEADTTITSTSPTTETTAPASGCPTGFYMCSAVYLGGCCRVDRNCDTTSCPSSDTTAVVTSGVTIAAGATTGSCANGWASCAANEGGGCCPSGYSCGASCVTVSGDQTQAFAKQTPSSVAAAVGVQRWLWSFVALGLTTGVGMVWL